jgi:hypothetical protein
LETGRKGKVKEKGAEVIVSHERVNVTGMTAELFYAHVTNHGKLAVTSSSRLIGQHFCYVISRIFVMIKEHIQNTLKSNKAIENRRKGVLVTDTEICGRPCGPSCHIHLRP